MAVGVVSNGISQRKGGDWVAIQMFHYAFYASYAFYGDLHNLMRFVYIEQYQVVA